LNNSIETYIVDSFTNEPFKGNPAGVCLTTNPLDEALMQSIAKELGLSETAFVQKTSESEYSIRYFSPKMEIPLCGHATLAASKVLFKRNSNYTKIQFNTIQAIELNIGLLEDGISMSFPIYGLQPAEAPPAMLSALGIPEIIHCAYNAETNILMLEITSVELLRKLSPNFSALLETHDSIQGVLVTALSDKDDFDFESRFFWPWGGTNEDPVTGGTHTFLAKYWGDKLNKKKLHSFQCSERTGFMELHLMSPDELIIKGDAQIIFRGELLV